MVVGQPGVATQLAARPVAVAPRREQGPAPIPDQQMVEGHVQAHPGTLLSATGNLVLHQGFAEILIVLTLSDSWGV